MCIYTPHQLQKFKLPHLQAGGWYIDCPLSYVPFEEQSMKITLDGGVPPSEIVDLNEVTVDEAPTEDHIVKQKPAKRMTKSARLKAAAQALDESAMAAPAESEVTVRPRDQSQAASQQWPAPSVAVTMQPPRRKAPPAPSSSNTSGMISVLPSLIQKGCVADLLHAKKQTGVHDERYLKLEQFINTVCTFPSN